MSLKIGPQMVPMLLALPVAAALLHMALRQPQGWLRAHDAGAQPSSGALQWTWQAQSPAQRAQKSEPTEPTEQPVQMRVALDWQSHLLLCLHSDPTRASAPVQARSAFWCRLGIQMPRRAVWLWVSPHNTRCHAAPAPLAGAPGWPLLRRALYWRASQPSPGMIT